MSTNRHNESVGHSGNRRIAGLDELEGQQRQIRFLTAALAENAVPHALLFTGEDGIGKRTVAINFAMALNCQGERKGAIPCGTCRSCRKILLGNHPDFHLVEAAGAAIRIEQIRNLCSMLSLKPYEAVVRVILICDAQSMKTEAANALLKILEEPPENTVFLMTAPQTADLLPTIVSRCQHIRFNPIVQHELERYLVEKGGLAPEDAMVIASLAGGSIGRALALREGDDWIALRNWIVDEISSLDQRPAGYAFALAEYLAGDKDRLRYAFEVMKHWFRDLAAIKWSPDKLYNRDLRDRLDSLHKRYTLDSLVEKTNAIEQAQRAVDANANVRLALEAMVLTLKRSNKKVIP